MLGIPKAVGEEFVGKDSAGQAASLMLVAPDGDVLVLRRSSGGDKIPSKGGPGITRSDLLVINKVDLAPYVGASLEVMDRDAKKMRGARPFVFTNLRDGNDADEIVRFIEQQGGLAA